MESPVANREPGHPGDFDGFFRAEYRGIVKVLMYMEGACLVDADDCVAYAMEKVFVRWNLPASDPDYVRHPRAYAVETAKRQFKKERRRVQTVALDEVEQVLAADEPALTEFEARQFVANVLEFLSPAQRQVLLLITEGYTPVEIAEVLRKKPNNVRQIVHQVKRRLRPLLGSPAPGIPQGEEESRDQ